MDGQNAYGAFQIKKKCIYVNNMVYAIVLKMVFRKVVHEDQSHTLRDLILNKGFYFVFQWLFPHQCQLVNLSPKLTGITQLHDSLLPPEPLLSLPWKLLLRVCRQS